MKFKIGEKVRFLNENGEGIVTKYINKTTLGITIEDGFELPYLETDLVSIFDGTVSAPQKPEVEEEPAPIYFSAKEERAENPEGIYLAISPEAPKNISNSGFNLWIINHSALEAFYTISTLSTNGFELIDKGEAKAFETKLAETIDKKNIDVLSTLKVEVLFYHTNKIFEHRSPLSEVLKLKTVKLYKENAFSENAFMPEKAYIINVTDFSEDTQFDRQEVKKVDLSKILLQKRVSVSKEKISKPHRQNNPAYEMEIDIHIEELADNWKGMSNAEIIQVQLRQFQKALDKAINERYRTLTVIHGVGNGRLKAEVRQILTSMNLRFHDASYSKYGFGATEVVIS